MVGPGAKRWKRKGGRGQGAGYKETPDHLSSAAAVAWHICYGYGCMAASMKKKYKNNNKKKEKEKKNEKRAWWRKNKIINMSVLATGV